MSESKQQLLTAYVDGVLTEPERIALEQWLQSTPGARQLLQQLLADRQRLLGLPRLRMPQQQDVIPLPLSRAGKWKRSEVLRERRKTVRVAQLAAILLITVSLGLIWLLTRDFSRKETSHRDLAAILGEAKKQTTSKRDFVQNGPARPGSGGLLKITGHDGIVLGEWIGQSLLVCKQGASSYWRGLHQIALQRWRQFEDRHYAEGILTSPKIESGALFKILEFRLPLLVQGKELATDPVLNLLKPGVIVHIDCAAGDPATVWETLHLGLNKNGLQCVVDPEAALRLSRRVPSSYLLFVENLELAQAKKLLESLARSDESGGGWKQRSIMMQSLDDGGVQWLGRLLRVAPSSLVPGEQSGTNPAGLDPTKPLAEETLRALLRMSVHRGPVRPLEQSSVLIALESPRFLPHDRAISSTLIRRLGQQADKVSLVVTFRANR